MGYNGEKWSIVGEDAALDRYLPPPVEEGVEQMFLGEYSHTIDDKGRMTVPAKFRGGLATGLVVTKGMDRCLVIYPLEAWRTLKARIAELPLTDRNGADQYPPPAP